MTSGAAMSTPGPGTRTEADRAEEMQRAWTLLLDSTDAIADSITLTLFERDDDIYERAGQELRADVRASCRQHIERGLAILAGRGSHAESAPELWRETGRRRARQGVPLETVLHAYTLGARMLWEALVDRVREDGTTGVGEGVLLAAASTVWSNLDVQNAVLIDAYRRESARLQRQDLQRQQATLDALLEGRGADPAYVEEARSVLGIDPDDALACLVVLHDGDPSDELASVEDRLDRARIGARWHIRGGVYFGLLFGQLPDEEGLVELLTPSAPGRMGVALASDGLPGFATAYLLAHRAAETLARHERRVVGVGDRLPEVLMVGSPQVAALLVSQVLGPLLAQPEAQRDDAPAHPGGPAHARRLADPCGGRPLLPPQHGDLPAQADRVADRPLAHRPARQAAARARGERGRAPVLTARPGDPDADAAAGRRPRRVGRGRRPRAAPAQTKALIPVSARPMSSFWIWLVPS